MIWLVKLCMLPTPAPDDAGDASFLGPSRAPTQKGYMWSRARAPEAPERAAEKEQLASQPGNANATKQIAAGVARAHAPKGPNTNGEKVRTARHTSQDRTKAQRSACTF